ncbi:hypothetical protein BpHYR1_038370 [Brachionus plicatilis]|uniref:Uncharacterized protein n=1 Tax=Brachionus plicatilis TaxID=10195 RepID=A0A3M7R1K8_BRAPC|nr:hypothetical protein BpHYR1_038370 [Brachionus plicatilis]
MNLACTCSNSDGKSIFSSFSLGQNCSLKIKHFKLLALTTKSDILLTPCCFNCSNMFALMRFDSLMSLSMASQANKFCSPNFSFSSSKFLISFSMLNE